MFLFYFLTPLKTGYWPIGCKLDTKVKKKSVLPRKTNKTTIQHVFFFIIRKDNWPVQFRDWV